MVRNVVFDMGMVLMDFHPLETCRATVKDEAGAQKIFAALFAHPEWVKLDDDSIEQDELCRRAMARLDDESLRALVPGIVNGMPYNVLTPIPGMSELVDWVIDSGFRAYLLSNAGRNVSQHREIIPGIERFNGVVFSVEEKKVKPDPALFQTVTDRYRLKPEECLLIDDNATNTAGARAVGWQAHTHDGNVPALRRLLDAYARALAD